MHQKSSYFRPRSKCGMFNNARGKKNGGKNAHQSHSGYGSLRSCVNFLTICNKRFRFTTGVHQLSSHVWTFPFPDTVGTGGGTLQTLLPNTTYWIFSLFHGYAHKHYPSYAYTRMRARSRLVYLTAASDHQAEPKSY